MARLPRLVIPGVPMHVIQRGNNKQDCFLIENDYKVYLSRLREYSQKYHVSIHSFVLMTNHVHLLLTPNNKDGISKLMQSLGRYYVQYFNRTHERTGTLWEGRYRSTVIDSEDYFLAVSRYIELNPVRAKIVEHPVHYPWSSFKKNAYGKDIKLVTEHFCYLSLGKADLERQKSYRALFNEQISDHAIKEIRNSVNKSYYLRKQ